MARSPITTRPAEASDLPTLRALCEELDQVGGRAERAVNPLIGFDVGARLLAVLSDPACRVILACAEQVPAGMVVLRIIQPDPLSDARMVQVSQLVVGRRERHRGVGHALLIAAAEFAEERRIDHLAVSVYPSLRDAHRFYARLGFAPAFVHRIAPVTVLRRRVNGDRPVAPFAEAVRRRTRLLRSVPPQPARRAGEAPPERASS
ncbi:MAG TPA: GNAT family N-acetyltransferase [Mycobacteriales bacterium]|nr:GNAT family N-acetyltransferase [Mycobacteriales bacterium]